MTFQAWSVFAVFWLVFVTTPGPNAFNCITNGMTLGFRRSLVGVAAILTQATLFLVLSAFGVTALIAASPAGFTVAKFTATRPPRAIAAPAGSVFGRALAIAVINPKSVAGYLAAFSQFVQPDVPIWQQMGVIMPTALALTTLSYVSYCALGAGLGRAALGAVFNTWLRRGLALCFILYGLLLGSAQLPQPARV